MADVPDAGSFQSRLRSHLIDPSFLITLVVGLVFWAAHGVGLVADVPLPVILAVLAVAWFVSCVASAAWPGVLSGWRLWVRVGAGLGVTALVIYAIGWGPMLAIGLLFGAADAIRLSGSSAVRPAMVWSAIWLGLGELAIALGVAPTLVDEPLVHGLGFLAMLGVIFTIQLLGRATTELERAQAELAESEQRFRALVQHASDIIMVIDPSNEVKYASPALETVLGYPVDEVIGGPGSQFLHPDDAAKLRETMLQSDARSAVTRAEVRLRHRDGTWRWLEVSLTNLFDDPSVCGWVANLRDVTQRKESEAALLEAQEAFRHAFEDAPVGMALVGIDGRIFRANRSFAELLGHSQAALVGVWSAELTHPDDRGAGETRHDQATYNEERGTYRFERRLLRADGGHVWVEATVSEVRDSEGTPIYYIGQVEDITERRALGERLAHEAAHDPMTGLPNRAKFMARAAEMLDASRQRKRTLGVLFVDLDHFKMVNDALGHAAGDELLVAIAERLRGALRPNDVVARFGGDEFVVLCGNLSGPSVALNVAHRLTKSIAEPITLPSGEVFVTASVGIALSSSADDTPESLLRHADSAMYLAKDHGRSRIEVFDPEHGESAVTLLKTGTELHRALERDELVLAYQPIVDLGSGRVVGFEALLRWNHPERGLLLPGEFIRLAEQVGLIVPIGAWVLETACRQTAQWQALRSQTPMPPITINVNLSPRQLADRGLVTSVTRIIRRTGIDARAVCLEITESSLMYDAERTISVLQALRDLGVHLSIDDFGTGFSSLSYLKRFPVEALKVDRTFVDGLGRDSEDTSIVKAVVELAHALGISAVAEGLETPDQLDVLRAIGCDYAQGFLLGRPLPAEVIGDHPADDLTTWQSATTA